jgi:hypothetical protein
MDAGRVDAIVVADQYTHAYSTKSAGRNAQADENLIADCTGARP